ncbi:MAG: HAD-IB family hydrolase [Candidatus Dormibacteraeota bacterium]|nr:HAD-IB family hydrolase [Candidatus Dormibacteraeota bacterium]
MAAFFDVDRTLLRGSSLLHVARPMRRAGMLATRAMLHSLVVQVRFSLLGFDEDQIRDAVQGAGGLVAGIDADDLLQFARRTVPEHVLPRVYTEAKARIAEHHALGHRVFLVSSSPEQFIAVLGELLDVTAVAATRGEVVDGRYTGRILRFCHGPLKAASVKELAAQWKIDLSISYAYGDSFASDLPMLELVGHPVAVNPDRALAAEALRRGWPVERFQRLVLRPRVVELRRIPGGMVRRSTPMMRRAHGHVRTAARSLRHL